MSGSIIDDPLRRPLTELLHERSLRLGPSPIILRSWVLLLDDAERATEREWIISLGTREEAESGLMARIERADGKISGGRIWERHGEFSTYLQFTHDCGSPENYETFGIGRLRTFDFEWLTGAPGRHFRSVEIIVHKSMPAKEILEKSIDLNAAVCCDVFDGAARIWSDFRVHDNHGGGGAGRLIVHDKGLRNDELSRLVQSLLEIGQYRKLALMGFPLARVLLTWIKEAEERLTVITEDVRSPEIDDQKIMAELAALCADVAAQMNYVRFRQGATRAYYRLTLDRLAALREQRVEGCSTVAEFIQRRLLTGNAYLRSGGEEA